MVEGYMMQIRKMKVLNNYFCVLWTLWGVRNGDVEFDYVSYGRDRAENYLDSKRELLGYLGKA